MVAQGSCIPIEARGNISMTQGTDGSLTTPLISQEEISSYVGRKTSGLLHVIDYPPELEHTFLKITRMFNENSGPFAIIVQEGGNTTDF